MAGAAAESPSCALAGWLFGHSSILQRPAALLILLGRASERFGEIYVSDGQIPKALDVPLDVLDSGGLVALWSFYQRLRSC